MNKYAGLYCLIRHLPDVARGEFINIGAILACDELQYIGLKTLDSFGPDSRAFALGHGDPEFVTQVMRGLKAGLTTPNHLHPDQNTKPSTILQTACNMYQSNNIQLTKPYGHTVGDAERTLKQIYEHLVQAPTRTNPL